MGVRRTEEIPLVSNFLEISISKFEIVFATSWPLQNSCLSTKEINPIIINTLIYYPITTIVNIGTLKYNTVKT